MVEGAGGALGAQPHRVGSGDLQRIVGTHSGPRLLHGISIKIFTLLRLWCGQVGGGSRGEGGRRVARGEGRLCGCLVFRPVDWGRRRQQQPPPVVPRHFCGSVSRRIVYK